MAKRSATGQRFLTGYFLSSTQAVSGDKSRLYALDGLRGLAAISVVLAHYAATFFPHAVFGSQRLPGHEWQDVLSRSPLFALYSGSYAVFIFFVLSGFVIAKSASSTTVPLALLVGRRYVRLTIPMLASTVLVYLLLNIFPEVTQTAADHLNNGWLAKYYGHGLSLKQAIFDALFNPYRFGNSYSNSVLWTMQTELFGSLSIYCLYRFIPRHHILLVLASLFLILIPQDAFLVRFLGFIGGALIYEAWSRGFVTRATPFAIVLLVMGFLLGGLPTQPADGTYFGTIEKAVGAFSSPFEFILGVAAIFTVLGCVCWAGALRFLEFEWFRFLGRISFGVYLIHLPILLTLGLYAYMEVGQTNLGFLLLSPGYFALVLLAAYLFTIAIDEPTLKALHRVKNYSGSVGVYLLHAALISLVLAFVYSRLGPDFGALLVWFIAYMGLLVALPLAAYNRVRAGSVQYAASRSSGLISLGKKE